MSVGCLTFLITVFQAVALVEVQAQLTIDTAKYEIGATTKSGAVVRYNMAFPIAGPYPKVRQFIDATLKDIPALAIDSVSIARKTIGDDSVEAQVRMTIFARSAP